jgi:hypothetical protein
MITHLNIISMTRAINMSIMPLFCFILNVSLRNWHTVNNIQKHIIKRQTSIAQIMTVAMVIPRAFSSGALSISSKATALALPSSARTYTKQ